MNVGLRNPSLGNRLTNTITMGVQCMLPGTAGAHRHVPSAIRFVVKGAPGACTVVEGEPLPMEEGDLLTTPNGTWHDHRNEGSEPVIWLDGLDARLARIGDPMFEDFRERQLPLQRPAGYSNRVNGHARPSWIKSEHVAPPFRYPWKDTYATLVALQEQEGLGDPCDGIRLVYSHPLTGGAMLPTFACEIQLLEPRFAGKAHRHNSSTIYHAFRGQGTTTVGDRKLEWAQGDIFTLPPWTWHRHENRYDQDAILFSTTDWPSMKALGLYREEMRA